MSNNEELNPNKQRSVTIFEPHEMT